jgi:ABC-type lipoprotein release transport system permease subunit
MNPASTLRIFALLALRNVFAHRVKSVIVGTILGFGTFLVLVGSAMLDSIETSMAKSITSSLAGDAQVFDKDAKDELALFGGMSFGATDIGEIDDFGKVRETLTAVPEVRAVVPMGIANASVFNGTELDRVLDELRVTVRDGDMDGARLLAEQVRAIATTLRQDLEAQAAIVADKAKAGESRAALDRALSDAFWLEFEAQPLPALDWLDNNIAPLASDGRMLFIRALGTDLDSYTKNFDRFRIVDGQPVPSGQRGFLFSKRFYEKQVKNKVARELDSLKEAIDEGKTIAADTLLQENVRRLADQYPRVLFQLTPTQQRELLPLLRAELGRTDGTLDELLKQLLTVDDGNFAHRYAFFYGTIAPMIRLYEAPVGETMTVRAYTKSGYVRTITVPVYGTFEFVGLESSDLASATNLTDLVTFRLLYGKMTTEQKAELAGIRADAKVKDVSRANAEAELFGGDAVVEATTTGSDAGFDEFAGADLRASSREAADVLSATYDRAEMESGLALSAAVLFKDPAHLRQGMDAVRTAADAAGLNLQVVDWQTASGIVGQLIVVLRVVLWVAIFIIFLVALFIINNSMVMTTMERVTEIGTMRAIGAPRSWVTGLGVAFIGWLGSVGIPAGADILVLLFAGPRLYPTLDAGNVLFGLVSVVAVSALSTLYPAILAARVQPVVAMTQKE